MSTLKISENATVHHRSLRNMPVNAYNKISRGY